MFASGVCVLHIFYTIIGNDLSSLISWSDALSYSSSKYVVRVKENIFKNGMHLPLSRQNNWKQWSEIKTKKEPMIFHSTSFITPLSYTV